MLKSVVGMDYSILRDLLAAGKWKEADEETMRVMLCVGEQEKGGWLREEDIHNFPCEDLRTIDQLWVKYSDAKFGFSVQKNIYQSLGGTRNYDVKIWNAFGEKVGWRKGEHPGGLYYEEISYMEALVKAPDGHLPKSTPSLMWVRVILCLISLFSRVETCQL
ncbi:GUN4 domain-containing protein [Trichormus variabilis]|uniref:GUN4-like domain-containing protein n=1 Tax=Trichormus variabilis SAG 1403-4b TaxID=447716 RepID=A0A433UWJ7_ANAVA|nr:GUN4 domain-containing protein [Trichormus variabilis FACHB-164]RUS98221.1 hypothetical protein DSM107003_13090 [Trichormus variabilis SAG 1403-4b]